MLGWKKPGGNWPEGNIGFAETEKEGGGVVRTYIWEVLKGNPEVTSMKKNVVEAVRKQSRCSSRCIPRKTP
jgi:hypothetical protein